MVASSNMMQLDGRYFLNFCAESEGKERRMWSRPVCIQANLLLSSSWKWLSKCKLPIDWFPFFAPFWFPTLINALGWQANFLKNSKKKTSRVLKGHDTLTDSRVIEAKSLEEAKQLFHGTLNQQQEYEEYSSSAWGNLDDIKFIDDPVVGSQIKSSDPSTMPLRQAGHIESSFTTQETKYLTTENTCVIDNLVGVYGKEQKWNKDKSSKILFKQRENSVQAKGSKEKINVIQNCVHRSKQTFFEYLGSQKCMHIFTLNPISRFILPAKRIFYRYTHLETIYVCSDIIDLWYHKFMISYMQDYDIIHDIIVPINNDITSSWLWYHRPMLS